MSRELPIIAILGAGSLGGALLRGLLTEGGATAPLRVTTRSVASAERLSEQFGIPVVSSEANPDANLEAARGAGVVVLAVKPAQILALAASLASSSAPVLAPGALVVSVAAGVTTAALEAALPAGTAVVRAMPNTPAVIGRAVTGLSAGSAVSPEQLALAERVFGSVGSTLTVPEERLDALTAISGSGPAYLFYWVEQWLAAAAARGFSPEEARALVLGTVSGATELLLGSGEDPAELRRRVTSPHGTTHHALQVFEGAGLGELFDRATAAAETRAAELAAAATAGAAGAAATNGPSPDAPAPAPGPSPSNGA